MLKRLTLCVLLVGFYGILVGCATREANTQDTTDTSPINYQVESNQIDDKLGLGGTIDNKPRVDSTSNQNGDNSVSVDLPNDSSRSGENPEPEFKRDEYRIGPDDLLDVQVFGVEELSQKVRVNAVGNISLPLIGEIQAAGLLSQELEDAIEAELSKDYLQNPTVNVYIEEFASQRVTIGGQVKKPGVYALRGYTTLLQTIAMAGGLAQLAKPEEISIIRVKSNNNPVTMTYSLEDILGGSIKDPDVKNGDYVFVGTAEVRKFFRDSIFRDVTDFFNPFRFIR
jgi:polysaccharide export outer membrane protein